MEYDLFTMENIVKIFMVVVAVTAICFLVSGFPQDSKGTAQDSISFINRCYDSATNKIECYHLCRDEGWIEDFCLQHHNDNIGGIE